MATSTGTWSSVGSTDDDCYCTEACSFNLEMCDLAVEAISNDELGLSDSDIDDMYDTCDTVHTGCLDECNGEDGYDAFLTRKSKIYSSRSTRSKQRNHHYTFDVDDNGVDINGFIVHHSKREAKKHKFRVFLDSNENNHFDRDDTLIGWSHLRKKVSDKGVGNLLDEDEIGQLEVSFRRLKSKASVIKRMKFSNDDDGRIAGFKRSLNETSSSSTVLLSPSYSHTDDPEWQKLWVENCTGDAKPPYPEDCFFGILY